MPSLENFKTPTKRKILEKKKNHEQDFLKVVDMMFLSFKILILDCVLVFFLYEGKPYFECITEKILK